MLKMPIAFMENLLAFALIIGPMMYFDLWPNGTIVEVAIILLAVTLAIGYDLSRTKRKRDISTGSVSTTALTVFSWWVVGIVSSAYAFGSFATNVGVLLVGLSVPIVFLVFRRWAPIRFSSEGLGAEVGEHKGLFLMIAYAIWALTALLDSISALVGVPLGFLSHERFFVAVLVFALLPSNRLGQAIRALLSVSLLIAFLKYPAATVLIGVALAISFYWISRVINSRARQSLAIAVLGLSLWGLQNPNLIGQLYGALGRNDNSSTRYFLWSQALTVLEGSPIMGGAAQMPISASFSQGGQDFLYPIHNTWLTLGVLAGWPAVIFLGFALISIVLAILRKKGDWRLLVPLVVACATISVNPTLERLDTAICFWFIVCSCCLHLENQNRTRLAESHLNLEPGHARL